MATSVVIDENHCVLCCEDIEFSACGPCDHSICLKCCVRLRMLRKEQDCPVCRTQLKEVIVSKGFKKWGEKKTKRRSQHARDFGISHEQPESQQKVNEILQHMCPQCGEIFKTFPTVKDHVRKVHVRFYCEICLQHLKLFTQERRCYTREELVKHRKIGDIDDRSYRGHPLCQFCEERYLDNDELLGHLRKNHFWCHLCEKDGFQDYYPEYKELRKHFGDRHFLCEEGDCIHEKFTTVFRSKIDYQAHRSQRHSDQLSKAEARQVRQLDVNITFTPRQNDSAGVVSNRDYTFPDARYGREKGRYGSRDQNTEGTSDYKARDGKSCGPGRNMGRDKDNERPPRDVEDRRRRDVVPRGISDGNTRDGRRSPRDAPQDRRGNRDSQRPPTSKRRAQGTEMAGESDNPGPLSTLSAGDKGNTQDVATESLLETNMRRKVDSSDTTSRRKANNGDLGVQKKSDTNFKNNADDLPKNSINVHSNNQFPSLSGETLSANENQSGLKQKQHNSAYKGRAAGEFQEEDFPALNGDKAANEKPPKQAVTKSKVQNTNKKSQPVSKFVDDFPALNGGVPVSGTTYDKQVSKKSGMKNKAWSSSNQNQQTSVHNFSGLSVKVPGTTSEKQSSKKAVRKKEQNISKLADDFPELSAEAPNKEISRRQNSKQSDAKKKAQNFPHQNKPVLKLDEDFPVLSSKARVPPTTPGEQHAKESDAKSKIADTHEKEQPKFNNDFSASSGYVPTTNPKAEYSKQTAMKKTAKVQRCEPSASYQDEFPTLATTMTNGHPKKIGAPPGLSRAAGPHPRPPPGLTWVAPPNISGLAQTSDNPAKQRNKDLVEEVSRILYHRGQRYDNFKSISGKFWTGSITAQSYYTECCQLLGEENIHKVFRKLIDLLPDEEKQRELLAVYNDAKVMAKQGDS